MPALFMAPLIAVAPSSVAFKEDKPNSYGRVFVKDSYVDKIIEASDASSEELKNNLKTQKKAP